MQQSNDWKHHLSFARHVMLLLFDLQQSRSFRLSMFFYGSLLSLLFILCSFLFISGCGETGWREADAQKRRGSTNDGGGGQPGQQNKQNKGKIRKKRFYFRSVEIVKLKCF